MSHTTIKRREFLALAAVTTGMALSAGSDADASELIAAPVQSTTPEGIALVSVAFATAGYQLSPVVADEVRKKLGGYPGGFNAVREFVLPNSVVPSMGHSAFLDIKRPPAPKTKTRHAAPPATTAPSSQSVPSSSDVKPLPVPVGTIQN